MKIASTKTLKSGVRRVVVMLDPKENLLAVRDDTYYRLGHPVADVVPGHVIADSAASHWCPVEQRWVE